MKFRFFLAFAAGALALFLCVVLVALLVQVSSLSRRLRDGAEVLSSQMRTTVDSFELLKSNLMRLVGESNEVRQAIGLPTASYDFGPDGRDDNENAMNALFFRGVDRVLDVYREERFDLLVADVFPLFPGFRIDKERPLLYGVFKESVRYAALRPAGDETAGAVEAVFMTGEVLTLGNRPTDSGLLSSSLARVDELLLAVGEAGASLAALQRNADLSAALREKGFTLRPRPRVEHGLQVPEYAVMRGDAVLFSVGVVLPSARFTYEGKEYASVDALAAAVAKGISTVDARDAVERRVDQLRDRIGELATDDGFLRFLASKDLELSEVVREDADYIYYDLRVPNGGRVGAFAIQRVMAEVYLVDRDDVPISALITSYDTTAKKKLTVPDAIPFLPALPSSDDSLTLLVAGAHERNTDTLIVVHVDGRRNEASLIGLPRDLYYKGRRINDIYRTFGPAQMARDIGAITGLEIRRYVVIDMYAFIDAVNILGGIEITLHEDLVDPTYRTKDDGRWSTLYYPRGTHLLDGLGALRVARSRHYSSDFGRAERQQQLLLGIQRKLSALDAGDMGSIYALTRTMLRYVDTDLTAYELVEAFLKYRHARVTRTVVLDTANVLYHTYSNLYYQGKSADEVPEDFPLGAWILLPIDNDWNVIRWYIRGIVEGDVDE